MTKTEHELDLVRRTYAKEILALASVADQRLEDAFAAVRREDFLPPGPWPIFQRSGTYQYTRDADPTHLYSDQLVGLAPERRINNGQPRLHAELLSLAGIRSGDHVVHIGAGGGYYSAIMAQLVGRAGRVTAIEFAGDLAQAAEGNPSSRSNVEVIHGDGSIVAFSNADVI